MFNVPDVRFQPSILNIPSGALDNPLNLQVVQRAGNALATVL